MTPASREAMRLSLDQAAQALNDHKPDVAIALLLRGLELPRARHIMRRICREFPDSLGDETLSDLLKVHPDDPYLLTTAGQRHLDAGRVEEARDRFAVATRNDPPRQAAFAGLCETAVLTEDWELLRTSTDEFLRQFPESEWARHYAARSVDHRSRFLTFDDGNGKLSALVLNYKCGFSTMNEATEGVSGWRRNLQSVDEFDQWRRKISTGAQPKVFSVCRHPMSRVVSYYWNWFLRLKPDFVHPDGQTNKPFGLVREVMAPRRFAAFLDAGREGRRTPEMFEQFVQTVPLIFESDPHLHPQHRVFGNLGLPMAKVEFFDLSRIGELLDVLELPTDIHVNNSKISDYDELVTPAAADIVNRLYSKDFLDLGYSKSVGC